MILKSWFIEEVELENGEIAQRQSIFQFDNVTGEWLEPEDETIKTVWQSVMAELSNINGQDVHTLVHPVTLRDLCNYLQQQQQMGMLKSDLSALALPDFKGFIPLRKKRDELTE